LQIIPASMLSGDDGDDDDVVAIESVAGAYRRARSGRALA
jgi:hypothetical protein